MQTTPTTLWIAGILRVFAYDAAYVNMTYIFSPKISSFRYVFYYTYIMILRNRVTEQKKIRNTACIREFFHWSIPGYTGQNLP